MRQSSTVQQFDLLASPTMLYEQPPRFWHAVILGLPVASDDACRQMELLTRESRVGSPVTDAVGSEP